MSKFTRKIASLGVTATTVIMLSGASVLVPVASAQSIADLLAQISLLQAQLVALQAGQAGGAMGSSYAFTRDLTVGSRGADVSALQQTLINAGHLKAVSAPTGYFGTATKAALAAWQAAKAVSPAAGYFGPKSRAAIAGSTSGTGTVGVTPVPAGSDLVVSLASDNPASRTLGSGTAFNPALKVVLTAGAKAVKVSSILVAKAGFLANTNLNGIDVVDQNGTRYGNVAT
ncbi:MAG: peptidoglycan-binding protein, partial [Patescibacteria group bacterium]